MPYLATDFHGNEFIFDEFPPIRNNVFKVWHTQTEDDCMLLPKGSIKALIGYSLKWEDEPVELTEELLKRD